MQHIIDIAARSVGNMSSLASMLGVTKAAVWQWKKDGRKVPIEHCVSIERMTNGVVTRRDLRPDDWQDIWPELAVTEPDQAPAPSHETLVPIHSAQQAAAHA